MSVLERPHYVIKPAELADWLDREPDTWWIVDGDRRLTGRDRLPCPGPELAELLRRYKKDLFFYPFEPSSAGPEPNGQAIQGQRFGELVDRGNPRKTREFLLSWSDRDEEWLLVEYPSSELDEDER